MAVCRLNKNQQILDLWKLVSSYVRIHQGDFSGPDPHLTPGKSESYTDSIQCCAIISPPAKYHLMRRHLNGVLLVRQW